MRIRRIRVDAFGRLEGFDTGAEPLGELVVVIGPNEAGKSTLFSFLTTALYGFHPASRERSPYVPWGADEASGRVELELDDGSCAHVERRLRSAPQGRLTEAGVARELRNQPLPWVEHVPRSVFRQVFAITLADLAGLDADTWSRIQDRLIGSMGSTDVGSARAVAEALEREASELWRPNRRGNQRVRDLQAEARALRARRTDALERDRRVRALVEERENVLVRLRETRGERQRHRVAVERVQSLAPVRRQLARIDALRSQGGPPDELRGIPPDPVAALDALAGQRARLTHRMASLTEALGEPEAALARFDEGARALLVRADEITAFVAAAAEVAPDRRRAEELRSRLGEIGLERPVAAEGLLDGGWREELAEPVAALSIELLRDRVARLRRVRERPTPAAEPRTGPDGRRTGVGIASAASAVLGGALVAWGATGGPLLAALSGAALATGGVIGALLALRRRGPDTVERPATPEPSAEERARAELGATLVGLPVRHEHLVDPGDLLVSGLDRLRALVLEERQAMRALARIGERIAAADRRASELAASLGRNGDASSEALAPALDRALREAVRVREAASSAERERGRLGREQAAVAQELAGVDARLATLSTRLTRVGDGDARRGADVARSRLEAHARADQLADELERSQPDLAELREQIRAAEASGDAWTMDDADLAARRAHMEELDGQIEELIAEAEALQRNAEHLREMETVDAVDSEIETLQEVEARLLRERDRRWVLAQLVREADRRFREEHQPDLIRRASAHLAHLTDGRYDRLLVDEAHPDGLVHIMGPALPAPVALAPPVSTGTLEQAYLSLRLAIVDHLDEGRDRLPLFIDEAFVNWDPDRRERGLGVLAELASARQLFVFTCHPETAGRLRTHGGTVVRLRPAR